MKLVSKFNLKNVATVGDLRLVPRPRHHAGRVTPSVYAPEPHHSRSERYAYISTAAVLDALGQEGFKPVFAAQASPRDASKRGFTKHLVRLRREQDLLPAAGECPEIVLMNSHGGESRFQEFGGAIRFLSLNIMFAGHIVEDVKIRHSGRLIDDAVEGAFRIVQQFDGVLGQIDAWKQIKLSGDERRAFAEAAVTLRFGENREGEPQRMVEPGELLTARRVEDGENDLWTVASVIQENVMAGGAEGTTRSPMGRVRRMTARPISGIDTGVNLNRALWQLTAKMAELKA